MLRMWSYLLSRRPLLFLLWRGAEDGLWCLWSPGQTPSGALLHAVRSFPWPFCRYILRFSRCTGMVRPQPYRYIVGITGREPGSAAATSALPPALWRRAFPVPPGRDMAVTGNARDYVPLRRDTAIHESGSPLSYMDPSERRDGRDVHGAPCV